MIMGINLGRVLDIWDDARRRTVDQYYRLYDFVSARVSSVRDSVDSLTDKADKTPELPVSRVPDGITVYAIGDIHGRADLLRNMVEIIKNDAARDTDPGHRHAVVFLGDYIDRGFQSRDVIECLLSNPFDQFETRFLKGNHEAAFIRFLDDASQGPVWANYGGVETLVSYNIQPPRSRENLEEWEVARKELVKVMPDEHRLFLERLELCLVLGDYSFVHAGMKPGKPLEDQSENDLLWIREEFLNDKKSFETVVVHGHTPLSSPHRDHRRIGVDTGAYMSGKLTAVRLCGDTVEFLST